MNTEYFQEQQPQRGLLRKTNTKITPFTAATFQNDEGTRFNESDDHIMVHFNGQVNGGSNGTFHLPDATYDKEQWQSDAQIAARKAMAKRSSRSYAARISRQKSRRRDMLGRQAKPGITVDTSFSSHRGNVPHQMYPHDSDVRHNKSIKKPGWFGLGRTSTKNKGLGITEGTPRTDSEATPGLKNHRSNSSIDRADPKTTDSLTSGSKSWQEISPWDRPIPIGISIPSDSVTDFSPYQANRQRSGSDSTLVTPSIVITPAAAMKSVWSPDTDSDYTGTPGRASSIYSRATFMPMGATPEVPPVPALPTGLSNWNTFKSQEPQTRARKDTLDSAGTAFEEEDEYDTIRKDRVMSSGTVFEEDDTPLRDRKIQSTLSIDTSMVPTPRRSQGWWNVITTPFMISRSNSVWTQNVRQEKSTPDVPTIPAQFGANRDSLTSPSTYIWSATEKSPSTNGDSPEVPASLSTVITTPEMAEQQRSRHAIEGKKDLALPNMGAQFTNVQFDNFIVHNDTRNLSQQLPSKSSEGSMNIMFNDFNPQQPPTKFLDGSMNIVFDDSDLEKGSSWSSHQKQLPPPKSPEEASHIHFNQYFSGDNETRDLCQQRPKSPIEYKNTQYNNIIFGRDSWDSLRQSPTKSPDGFKNAQFNNFVFDKETSDVSRQPPKSPEQNITSPLSALSASPVVGTAAMGTVLMPRQVEESSRPINITIELHDRRTDAPGQAVTTTALPPPNVKSTGTPPPAPQIFALGMSSQRANGSQQDLPMFAPPPFPQSSSKQKTNTSQQELPVFAPPPALTHDTSTKKANTLQKNLPVFAPPPRTSSPYSGSRASSVSSSPDLSKPQKKHRKVSPIMNLLPCGKRKRDDKKDDKKKRRSCFFWCCGCCIIILILLAIIIPLSVVLTKRNKNGGNVTEVDPSKPSTPSGLDGEEPSRWLNLTGYPPIPTGISTIAQPEAVEEESGCVAPTTLWSCALPKELHDSVSPNKPDQPNFKLEIVFDNSTSKPSKTKRAANPVSVGAFIRERLLHVRAAPSASPAPPSNDDMMLLGKTTEKNEAPFEGEDTPFFISFQDPKNTASRLVRRATTPDPTNITSVIPPPMLNSDGTAAPANLYPFPSSQPLRLFNRGKDTEHYGFYSYFDRSIFLKDITMGNGRGGNPADKDGGSAFDAASMRCTFSQTRFLVQIWTRSQTTKPLLQSSGQGSSEASKRPGSFPYPVTVTMDRHGGDVTKKNLYCYKMESDGTIKDESSKRDFQFEDRGFGGNLVNGTQGRPNAKGPIDGGSGGCSCQWQNWLN